MSTDKFLIILATVIVLAALFFKKEIVEEIELFRKFEKRSLFEGLTMSYFYPLSQQERIEILKEHIDKMTHIQKRVSTSILAKYFVDFSEHIIERQNELLEKQESIRHSRDFISFSTFNLNNVVASLHYPREQLLKIACLIDEIFPEDAGNALYALDWKGSEPLLTMSLFEDFPHVDKQRYKEFVNRISKEIFDGQPVYLHVSPADFEEKQVL